MKYIIRVEKFYTVKEVADVVVFADSHSKAMKKALFVDQSEQKWSKAEDQDPNTQFFVDNHQPEQKV